MSRYFAAAALAAAMTLGAAGAAVADGRYTMQPVEGGFLRMDTQTGEVTFCEKADDWACAPVADERKEYERRLAEQRVKNDYLREQVRALGAEPAEPTQEEIDARIDLPTDEELDAAVDIMKKVADRFSRLVKIMRDEVKDLGDEIDAAGKGDESADEWGTVPDKSDYAGNDG